MSRSSFTRQVFKLSQLSLWRDNPRLLYKQADEMACIAKMLENKTFMVLLEDIAKNGLGITPIVAIKVGNEFVVMDGNRRTAALKLLANPSLCPADLSGIKDRIANLATLHSENVLDEVECLVTNDRDAVIQYILTTHTGEQGGAGQVDWNALMQAAFGSAEGVHVNYKPAYRLLNLAQSHGYKFSDDYPISTLGRFAIKEFCEKFGIDYPADATQPLKVINNYPSAVAALIEFVSDIGEKKINVSTADENSIRGSAFRAKYIESLHAKHYKDGASAPITVSGNNTSPEGNRGIGEKAPESEVSSNNIPSPSPKPTPKPTWDRTKLILSKRHTVIPKQYVKEYNVFADMMKLQSKDTQISCAVMLRVLFEATLKRTVEALGSEWRPKSLAKNTEFIAEQMLKSGYIDTALRDSIVKFSGKDQSLAQTFFTVDTIQSIIHSKHFHPTREDVNIFWDTLDPFIAKCWEMVVSKDKENS